MAAAAAAESRPIFTPPSAFDETKWSSSTTEESQSLGIKLSSCPLCYEPLIRKGPTGLNLQVIYSSTFKGKKCYKSYSSKNIYLDLTVTAGFRQYIEVKPVGTELFTKWWHLCWNHFSTPRSPGHSSHSHRGFFPAGTISGKKRSRTCVHDAVSPTTRAKLSNLSSSFLLRNLEQD